MRRAGATEKTTSAQNQVLLRAVLLRALAGAFLLLALRVEPAAACAADAASFIFCQRSSSKQRALSSAIFLDLFSARSIATIALLGAEQACNASPACPFPAPAEQLCLLPSAQVGSRLSSSSFCQTSKVFITNKDTGST